MYYTPVDPDFDLSPATGMTRRHWLACGRKLLEGVFRHVRNADSPIDPPKVPGKSYPRPDDPPHFPSAMRLEALVRSYNLAAPLVADDPDLRVNGIHVGDYYRRRLLDVVTPGTPTFIPLISTKGPGTHQMTCEFGGISAAMTLTPVLWDGLTRAEQDRVAVTLLDYAHGPTHPHNWRYFNVMMGTFLRTRGRGYKVDAQRMDDHHENLLALHAGDGWFRDSHFDYYTAWCSTSTA